VFCPHSGKQQAWWMLWMALKSCFVDKVWILSTCTENRNKITASRCNNFQIWFCSLFLSFMLDFAFCVPCLSLSLLPVYFQQRVLVSIPVSFASWLVCSAHLFSCYLQWGFTSVYIDYPVSFILLLFPALYLFCSLLCFHQLYRSLFVEPWWEIKVLVWGIFLKFPS